MLISSAKGIYLEFHANVPFDLPIVMRGGRQARLFLFDFDGFVLEAQLEARFGDPEA